MRCRSDKELCKWVLLLEAVEVPCTSGGAGQWTCRSSLISQASPRPEDGQKEAGKVELMGVNKPRVQRVPILCLSALHHQRQAPPPAEVDSSRVSASEFEPCS